MKQPKKSSILNKRTLVKFNQVPSSKEKPKENESGIPETRSKDIMKLVGFVSKLVTMFTMIVVVIAILIQDYEPTLGCKTISFQVLPLT